MTWKTMWFATLLVYYAAVAIEETRISALEKRAADAEAWAAAVEAEAEAWVERMGGGR